MKKVLLLYSKVMNGWKNDEIHFNVGTVFRIESIEQAMDSSLIIWCVKLELIRKDDPQLFRILTPF